MRTLALLVAAVYLTPAAVLALLLARQAKRPAPAPTRVHTCDLCAGIDPLHARVDVYLWSIEMEGVE